MLPAKNANYQSDIPRNKPNSIIFIMTLERRQILRQYGSVTFTLLNQLEYWSKKYPKGFYKFMDRCSKHPLYRDGDSWVEEMNADRRTLRKNFEPICKHYRTKSEYLKAEDKFEGRLYASYVDRKTSQTFYIRNHSLADQFYKSPSPPQSKNSKAIVKMAKLANSIPNMSSPNDIKCPSLARGNIESPARSTNTHNITSLSPVPCVEPSSGLGAEVELIKKQMGEVKEMVDIWNKAANDNVVILPGMVMRLANVLKSSFNGSLRLWEEYCYKIASSEFCMGKAINSKFKAVLHWAIKPDTIKSIAKGGYGVGKLFVQSPQQKYQSQIENEIKQINNQITDNNYKISYSHEEVLHAQDKTINELRDSLKPEQIEAYRKQSDEQFDSLSPLMPEEDRRIRQICKNAAFEGKTGFLYQALKKQLGISDWIAVPKELIDKKNELEKLKQEKSLILQQINKNDDCAKNLKLENLSFL